MKKLYICSCVAWAISFFAFVNESFATKRYSEIRRMAHIEIKMQAANFGDTIRLASYDQIYMTEGEELKQPHSEIIATKNKNGKFIFDIPVRNKLAYISLYKDKVADSGWPEPFVPILREYIVQPNDEIKIDIVKNKNFHVDNHLFINHLLENKLRPSEIYCKAFRLYFCGHGSAKFKLRYSLDDIINSNYEPVRLDSMGALAENKAISMGVNLFERAKLVVNPFILHVLKADFTGKVEARELKSLWLDKRYNLICQYFDHSKKQYNEEVLLKSRIYPFFLISKFDIEYPNRIGEKALSTGAYYYIKQEYKPSELRDKLLFIYLLLHANRLQNAVFEDAERTIKTPLYHKMIDEIANEITPGKMAYNFLLTDTSGKKVKLSDFKGKVVFMDFWFTGCQACKGYFANIVSTTEERMSRDTNIVFLAISIDRNKEGWVRSVKKGDYTSEKAVNLFTNGEGQLNPVISHYQVQGYPRPILIDKEGRIFTGKETQLRNNGVEGLINSINEALKL